MRRPRTSEELERAKDRIIDAALAIIVEEGFPCLTMRRLASRLHMSAPNLYNFFASKDEIYITIVIKGFRMLQEELERAASGASTPEEKARAMIEAYVDFGTKNSPYYDIMFTMPTPKYKDYQGTPYEKLSEVEYRISMDIAGLAAQTLRELSRGGVQKDEDLTHDLVHIWCLVHGMVSLANSNIIGYVASDVKAAYQRIVDDIVERYRG